jgi:hypothetical protein
VTINLRTLHFTTAENWPRADMMEGRIFETIDVADLGDVTMILLSTRLNRSMRFFGRLPCPQVTWGSVSKRKSYPHILGAASTLLLDGRTLHGAERTENTAVAGIGTKQGLTIAALIEKLASVGRHEFLFSSVTMRTGQDRFENNGIHKNGIPSDVES